MDPDILGSYGEYDNADFDPSGEWHRPNSRGDLRHFPERTGGRVMLHPFYDPIIYPRVPDRTINMATDPLRRNRSALTQTHSAMAIAQFPDPTDGVIIQEVWLAQQLSTFTELFHQFRKFWVDPLPPGRYLGWIPRDLTWRRYHVDILDVICGQPDEFIVEELGVVEPFLMREQLTVTFRVPQEFFHPAGSMVGMGA